jgi:hypothetical protein
MRASKPERAVPIKRHCVVAQKNRGQRGNCIGFEQASIDQSRGTLANAL